MLTAQRTAAVSGRATSRLSPALPSRLGRTLVIRRFRDDEKRDSLTDELQQQLASAASSKKPTETRLTPDQLQEVYNREPGNISPRMAEMRADLGSTATDLSQFQAFDGPIPETVNGRLAMLGVVAGLYAEAVTGRGLLQQTIDHPIRILFFGLLIAFASYAPVIKGYTRKEPFSNLLGGLPWTPLVENWNGRLAMLGFTGMILTEAITGVNTLQAWGLQSVPFVPFPPVLWAVAFIAAAVRSGCEICC